MTRYLIIIAVVMLLLNACRHDEILLNKPNNNEALRSVGGYISNNYDYSLLAAALDYTGLLDSLTRGPGPYTLLAPGNEAFQSIGVSSENDIRRLNKDSLRETLLFHILPVRLLQSGIPINQHNTAMPTLEGRELLVSRSLWSSISTHYLTSFSGAELKKQGDRYLLTPSDPNFTMDVPDYPETELTNGVIQRIDRPLRPHFSQTVQEYLSSQPDYSIFVAGLKKFGLWDELSAEGPFTIFAPTDATFIKYGITGDAIDAMDPSAYTGALLFGAYIVYDQQLLISDFDFFFSTREQNIYQDVLRGAPEYFRFLAGPGMTYYPDDYYHFGNTIFGRNRKLGWAYSIAISKENKPWGYRRYTVDESEAAVLGTNDYTPPGASDRIFYYLNGAFDRLPMGMDRNRCNNLCSNGVVHPFHALAVLPEEAKK